MERAMHDCDVIISVYLISTFRLNSDEEKNMKTILSTSNAVTNYCSNAVVTDYTDGNKRSGIRFSTAKGRGRFLEAYELKDGRYNIWCKDLTLLLALTGALEKDVKVHEKDTLKYSITVAKEMIEAAVGTAKKAEPKAKAAPAKKTAAKKAATTKR